MFQSKVENIDSKQEINTALILKRLKLIIAINKCKVVRREIRESDCP